MFHFLGVWNNLMQDLPLVKNRFHMVFARRKKKEEQSHGFEYGMYWLHVNGWIITLLKTTATTKPSCINTSVEDW